MHILNAFSLNMLPSGAACSIQVRPLSLEEARDLAVGAVSAVGHVDTAAVFSSVLGIPVPCQRINVLLSSGEKALVGQYRGPRLPEGTTVLPQGATIEWSLLTVLPLP